MGSNGWDCHKCSYHHRFPGTRCSMCHTLRTTGQQMRDFVVGKTVNPQQGTAAASTAMDTPATSFPAGSAANEKAPNNNNNSSNTSVNLPTSRPGSSGSACAIRNPYARPKKQGTGGVTATSTNASHHPAKLSASMRPQSSQMSTTSAQATVPANYFTGTAAPRNQQTGVGSSVRLPTNAALPALSRQAVANYAARAPSSNHPVSSTRPSQPEQQKKNPFTLAAQKPIILTYIPGPVPLCLETASDGIYPLHKDYPIRDYQLEISKTAILNNTLVSLPTGLGKTLIAAVVLYNFYRWFPDGKIVFLAPTLPLVNQQIKACYNIMGIPPEHSALLTGKVGVDERQRLWKERRVFFCTPQTVQKDIDAGRCTAKSIVCLVLDEAHKASGEYAYTKVVQQIEAAGAKFRILGLSATPGTDIKAIQKVIEALRINKIEARLEDDESVRKYVHERQTEIVVVKQVSVITTVERLLNDLISPLLERLRMNNGLALIRGNATVTSFAVLRGREEYVTRTGDHSLDGYFFTAQKFVQVRSDIRQHGIGVAKAKLLRIQNECRGGLLSSVLKGKEYQAVWTAVLQATSDPNNSQESAQDRKLNNPKLMKLDEILTEHFERARACEASSRAIVFSQWRESVEEIVAVLTASQPLLRPRQFVGQGKAAGGTARGNNKQTSARGGGTSSAGMKQKEQQQVIREFRSGTFNVLVCTCIGEEGLDIGEVDLIVNFDTLRSPIRMIQRVGRTGRKRDGRVVCLVSEGAEERSLKASKVAEKTLGRALKKPSAFKVTRTQPMFPQAPILNRTEMTFHRDFRLSQVGGHGRPERSSDNSKKTKAAVDLGSWRLTETQEKERLKKFGNIDLVKVDAGGIASVPFPQVLRRTCLRARSRTCYKSDNNEKSVGVTRSIVREMERLWNADACGTAVHAGGNRPRRRGRKATTSRSLRDKELFEALFPLEHLPAPYEEDIEGSTTIQVIGGYEPDIDSLGEGRANHCAENHAKTSVSDRVVIQPPIARPLPQHCGAADVGLTVTAAPRLSDTENRMDETSLIPTEIVFSTEMCDAETAPSDEFRLPTPPASSASSSSEDDSDDELQNATSEYKNGAAGIEIQRVTGTDNEVAMAKTTSPASILVARPAVEASHREPPNPLCLQQIPNQSRMEEANNERTPSHPDVSLTEKNEPSLLGGDDAAGKVQAMAEQTTVVGSLSDGDPESQFLCLPTQESSSSEDESTEKEVACASADSISTSKREKAPENGAPMDADQCNRTQSEKESERSSTAVIRSSDLLSADAGTLSATKESEAADSAKAQLNDGEPSNPDPAQSPRVEFEDFNSTTACAVDEAKNIAARSEELSQNKKPTTAASTKTDDGGMHVLVDTPEKHLENKNSVAAVDDSGTDKVSVAEGTAIRQACSVETAEVAGNSKLGQSLDEDEEGPNLEAKSRNRKRARQVVMTQEPCHVQTRIETTPATAQTRSIKPSPSSKDELLLVDTPQTAEDYGETDPQTDVTGIVCAICFSGESPDNDPIVLCDGPENDYSCDLAVHKSCYDITVGLDDVESWRCDRCEAEHRRRTHSSPAKGTKVVTDLEISCRICLASGGALWKRGTSVLREMWVHPTCKQWSVGDEHISCSFCHFKGAVQCNAEGCTMAAHPYCAVNVQSPKKHWTLIQIHSEGENGQGEDKSSPLRLMYCARDEASARDVLAQSGMDCSGIESLPRCVFFVSNKHDPLTDRACDGMELKRKRLRKKTRFDLAAADVKVPSQFTEANDMDDDGDEDEQVTKRQRIRKRIEVRQRALFRCGFIDSEAGVDTDDDVDGDADEEFEALRIEGEEMSHDSFINDTSQLGAYTQDELDGLDSGGNSEMMTQQESTALHRGMDNEKQRLNQFATPIFNRRMMRRKEKSRLESGESTSEWDMSTPMSAPSSQKGLGKMNFIRSVLEHHRKGGRAEEIEKAYLQIEQESATSEAEPTAEKPSGPSIVMQYVDSDSEASAEDAKQPANTESSVARAVQEKDGPVSFKPPGFHVNNENRDPNTLQNDSQRSRHRIPKTNGEDLSEEQRALIEAKRQEALRRRQQRTQNNSVPR